MGLKAKDLSGQTYSMSTWQGTVTGGGPTVNNPPAKDVVVKAFQVARTETAAAVKAMLPWNASVININMVGVASDAPTSANVSVGTTSTSTEWVNAQDVKTAGGFIQPASTFSAANLPNLENPGTALNTYADIPVYAKYAETGTSASTTGGPYTVFVYYVP